MSNMAHDFLLPELYVVTADWEGIFRIPCAQNIPNALNLVKKKLFFSLFLNSFGAHVLRVTLCKDLTVECELIIFLYFFSYLHIIRNDYVSVCMWVMYMFYSVKVKSNLFLLNLPLLLKYESQSAVCSADWGHGITWSEPKHFVIFGYRVSPGYNSWDFIFKYSLLQYKVIERFRKYFEIHTIEKYWVSDLKPCGRITQQQVNKLVWY